MTIVAPVSRATLEETVRWRLMSVCLVLVRMEGHVLTLLTGTAATAQLTLRYSACSTLPVICRENVQVWNFTLNNLTITTTAYICLGCQL